jgi:uncharacterized Rossmann fold enzyme
LTRTLNFNESIHRAVMTIGKAPGAQFEISIDSKPRSYRDRKAVAIEAAEYLKRQRPNSEVVVKDLASGKETAVEYKSETTQQQKPRR